MFLHVQVFDNQISVHSNDAVPAVNEVRDKDGNVTQKGVPAKSADPLRVAVRQALDYWKRTETDIVVLSGDKKLDPNKTAVENGLKENDLITVVSSKRYQEILDANKPPVPQTT